MARKTFISYKYSDVVEGKSNNLRDRIIEKLGDASRFYRGEKDTHKIYRLFQQVILNLN